MNKMIIFLLFVIFHFNVDAFYDNFCEYEKSTLHTKFFLSSRRFVDHVYLNVNLKTREEIRNDLVSTRDYYRDLAIEEINKAEKMMDDHFDQGVKAIYNATFDIMLSALWNNMCVLVVAKDIGKGESATFKNVIINYFEFRNQLSRIDERIDMYNWCQDCLDYIDSL